MTAPAVHHDLRCGTWQGATSACTCRGEDGHARDEPATRRCSADCPEPAAYQVGPESPVCGPHLRRVLDAYLEIRRGCAPVAPISHRGGAA